jgi:hypothetical protein
MDAGDHGRIVANPESAGVRRINHHLRRNNVRLVLRERFGRQLHDAMDCSIRGDVGVDAGVERRRRRGWIDRR